MTLERAVLCKPCYFIIWQRVTSAVPPAVVLRASYFSVNVQSSKFADLGGWCWVFCSRTFLALQLETCWPNMAAPSAWICCIYLSCSLAHIASAGAAWLPTAQLPGKVQARFYPHLISCIATVLSLFLFVVMMARWIS
jgi:hypothetical protein